MSKCEVYSGDNVENTKNGNKEDNCKNVRIRK